MFAAVRWNNLLIWSTVVESTTTIGVWDVLVRTLDMGVTDYAARPYGKAPILIRQYTVRWGRVILIN